MDAVGCVTKITDARGNLISEQIDGEAEIPYEYTVEQRLSAIREGEWRNSKWHVGK